MQRKAHKKKDIDESKQLEKSFLHFKMSPGVF